MEVIWASLKQRGELDFWFMKLGQVTLYQAKDCSDREFGEIWRKGQQVGEFDTNRFEA